MTHPSGMVGRFGRGLLVLLQGTAEFCAGCAVLFVLGWAVAMAFGGNAAAMVVVVGFATLVTVVPLRMLAAVLPAAPRTPFHGVVCPNCAMPIPLVFVDSARTVPEEMAGFLGVIDPTAHGTGTDHAWPANCHRDANRAAD